MLACEQGQDTGADILEAILEVSNELDEAQLGRNIAQIAVEQNRQRC